MYECLWIIKKYALTVWIKLEFDLSLWFKMLQSKPPENPLSYPFFWFYGVQINHVFLALCPCGFFFKSQLWITWIIWLTLFVTKRRKLKHWKCGTQILTVNYVGYYSWHQCVSSLSNYLSVSPSDPIIIASTSMCELHCSAFYVLWKIVAIICHDKLPVFIFFMKSTCSNLFILITHQQLTAIRSAFT